MTTEEYKEFVNYREEDDAVNDILTMLESDGAYNNMISVRNEKDTLEASFNNIFTADTTLTASTKKTQILKSHIVRTIVEVYVRGIEIPTFDIESVNKSKFAFEEKTRASITKALIEWFQRVSGYEDVANESKEDMCAYGDRNIRPFVRKIKGSKKVFPAVEDLGKEDLMIDPNASYVTSESVSKQAQYYAYTQMYPAKNLVARFGEWILDYAKPGAMIDEGRVPSKGAQGTTKTLPGRLYPKHEASGTSMGSAQGAGYYEVLEVQDKSAQIELLLVGGNAFPVIRNVENDNYDNPEAPHELAIWTNKYKYRDSFGEPILTLANQYFYFNPNSPYNRGITHKLAVPQVMHEIVENLKADNIVQRLTQTKYIAGGNAEKIRRSFQKYKEELRTNRDAMWYLGSSLNEKNIPQPGVLKFEGLTALEGEQITTGIMDFVTNAVGVSPKRQEVQKNIGVGQSELLAEEKTEAIEAIAENNLPNYRAEQKMFLAFIVGHEGFGLNDVHINFTKYDEETPEGNVSATISIPEAAKQVKGFEFDVIIDKSSLVKRSRFIEGEQLTKFLGLLDPAADPKGFKAIRKQIAKNLGIEMPDVSDEEIAMSRPQGGRSQYQTSEQGRSPAEGMSEPAMPPEAVPPPEPQIA